MSESEAQRRRRWINFGELIALAALIVSALGVWISWKDNGAEDKPTRIVEQHQAIPLSLRGKREDDGAKLEISPIESSHGLESLTVKLPNAPPIEVGSDGELNANDVKAALNGRNGQPKNSTLSAPIQIGTRYVEAGRQKSASGTYTLRYMWKGGGMFGGDSVHLVSLSR